MSGRTNAGLRRAVREAEPVTGRLSGTPAQLAGLVARGLAFRHARPPGAYFLTPSGHRLRQELLDDAPPAPAPSGPADTGMFVARTGAAGEAATGAGRDREVHSAWQGLLELRRMTHPDGSTERPCGWERAHLVPAAALALEAAGCVPASGTESGYRVTDTAQPEAVAVRLISGAGPDDSRTGPDARPAGLAACAQVLEAAGWQTGLHTERDGSRCVLASPRRI